jgi:hypothetical protein
VSHQLLPYTYGLTTPSVDTVTHELEPLVAEWADRIRPHLEKTYHGIVGAGRELIAAKEALPHGRFTPLCRELGISVRVAERFMRVAAHPVIANATPGSGLPASASVLDVLIRLGDEELEQAVNSGEVTATTTRRQALELVRQRRPPMQVTASMRLDVPPLAVRQEAWRGETERRLEAERQQDNVRPFRVISSCGVDDSFAEALEALDRRLDNFTSHRDDPAQRAAIRAVLDKYVERLGQP